MNTSRSLKLLAWLWLACAVIATDVATATAQTIWCGPSITFQQSGPGQADVLTPSVAINRGFTAGIFNSAVESGYVSGSPAGTAWAFGRAAQHASLPFLPWATAVDNLPPDMVGREMVVHLIAEDIYVDVRFLAWAVTGGSGSRFTYERSTSGPCAPAAAVPAVTPWIGGLSGSMLALLGAFLIAKRAAAR